MTDFVDKCEQLFGNSAIVIAMRDKLCVLLVDLSEKIIIGATPAAERLFQYQGLEMIGIELNDLIPKDYRDSHDDYINEFIKNPKQAMMGDRRLPALRKDGSKFTLSIWLIPAKDGTALCVCFE